MNFRPLHLPLSGVLIVLAVVMALPALADGLADSAEWRAFLFSSLITVFIAGLLYFSRADARARFTLRHCYLFTVLCWVLMPLLSALPFYFSNPDLSFTDSIFEAVSGLSTTGATVMTDLERLPPGILIWRALLQWVGGMGVVVLAISMMPVLKAGGMQLFRLESSETSDKTTPRIRNVCLGAAAVYLTLSFLCMALYRVQGMSLFDASIHAMTTLSTGGFSTKNSSFAAFHDLSVMWTACLFMVLGSVPFSVFFITPGKPPHRRFFGDRQIRAFLGFLCFIIVGCAAATYLRPGEEDFFYDLTLSAFNIISVVTTTGYACGDYTEWGAFAPLFFFFLTFVGGCSGSTAGGVKIFRFQVLFLLFSRQLGKLASPSRVFVQTINGRKLTEETGNSVMMYVAVLIMSFTALSILLGMTGLDVLSAFSGAATALSNVGPGIGDVIGPTGNFATLPDSAKWLLSLGMLLGRLEYITALALLDAAFWRN